MRPLVSFVLPTYNAEGPLFERALASIRAQRYPSGRVEVVVADGGSTDATRDVALRHGARVVDNPNKLAEFGVKEGILAAEGDIAVVFAADNELVGEDWLHRVASRFERDSGLAAIYGRLVSGPDDPPLNKYVALIQSEPLTWFLNRNLDGYLAAGHKGDDGGVAFAVDPSRPLVWGANGLAVRRAWAEPIWRRDGYVADVDAFQELVASGRNRVVYFPGPYVFHHQVATLADMRRKWLRNTKQHLFQQAEDRRLDWVFVAGFRRRALLFGVYSFVPVFSVADAFRRAVADRSPYWFFHPAACFLQALTYAEALLRDPAGRQFLRRTLLGRPV